MFINLDSYRVFYYVARYSSFTKAAAMLYSNQPNVTRTVKKLETSLGCQLFIRSSRSVRLTPEGEKLFAHIRIAMEQIASGEAEVMRMKNLEGGSLSIGVSEVALRCFLLPILKEYQRCYPGVRLKILNHSTPQAIGALREGITDLAFVTVSEETLPGMTVTPLREYRETPVCGPGFGFLCPKKLTLAELAAYPIISLGPETQTYWSYSDWFRENGLAFHPDVEASTADQILPMVRSNLGIGFVPEDFLQEQEAAEVYPLTLTTPMQARFICCVRRSDRPLSVAARAMDRLLEKMTP